MNTPSPFTRRRFVQAAAATTLAPLLLPSAGWAQQARPATRAIPSSGEAIPLVGLGSWSTFNVGNDTQARDACAEVIRNFLLAGGKMIDSSPMYGSSQAVIGYGLNKLGQSKNVFSADKVWIADGAADPAQIEASRRDWGVPRFDLLQVHNLLSWEAHLPMLFAMKAAERLRYVGITTSHGRRHHELEQIMTSQPIDFVQLTYNLVDCEARIGTIRRSGISGGAILRYEVCPYLCTDPATILNFKAAALIQTLTCKLIAPHTMPTSTPITFSAFLQRADYSLLRSLTADPEQARHHPNKRMREVKSGHYVEVEPTPLPNPHYVIHSRRFFNELNLPDSLAREAAFMQFFTGNPTLAVDRANAGIDTQAIRTSGWASGYALSIYGQEMVQNCPFKTGNGYGDGRAISVLEVVLAKDQRWEFQLKGGGTTPYCRGGDGRAILRSSIREFLVSEAMAALGVPTTRALCLYVSQSETITRPWYSPNAKTQDPDRMVDEPAAITTRVAPSFLRVGQLELFGRRARNNEHPNALAELEAIFLHVLDREYPDLAAQLSQTAATLSDKVLAVAREFAQRLAQLMAHWIRVGYCQGNFNSDNCALGGRTLDYGPFGFIEAYDPAFQMWTGGGEHFSFMNQPMAAMENFRMYCIALVPLLKQEESAIQSLQAILNELPDIMQREMNRMWASKMGLAEFNAALFTELHTLMTETPVDYTLFWRELSNLPTQVAALQSSFYETHGGYAQNSASMDARWQAWLEKWHIALQQEGRNPMDVSAAMKQTNPKYIPREWMLVEAYRSATDNGDFSLVHTLHDVLAGPYSEQTDAVAALYYKKKEEKFFNLGGTSHCSCSS